VISPLSADRITRTLYSKLGFRSATVTVPSNCSFYPVSAIDPGPPPKPVAHPKLNRGTLSPDRLTAGAVGTSSCRNPSGKEHAIPEESGPC
jgi:hypothetical protein